MQGPAGDVTSPVGTADAVAPVPDEAVEDRAEDRAADDRAGERADDRADDRADAERRARVRARLLDTAPEAVRGRVADLLATAVGRIPVPELPAAVRPVARFAPAKRAKVGATPLLAALTGSEGFADQVVAWWRENRPEEWCPEQTDTVGAAATALLEGRDDGVALVRDVEERADVGRLRAERDTALARVDKLAGELDRVTAERDEARAAAMAAGDESREEISKLRARLRDQGVRVRRADDEAAGLRAAIEAGEGGLRGEIEKACRERDRQREVAEAAEARAQRAVDELTAARRAAREARRADDARLALLVDTVAGVATGLRYELGLRADDTGPGPRPAELVGSGGSGARTVCVTDPAALDRVLGLPEVHLVIDGYNVTKTGWPDLSLALQRERLVQAVAPLTARTGSETTVVFDGAGVTGVPTHSVRGVRVLFSDPGVLADDLIRSLVAAEPAGRPLVVVTSDRAVADSVRRQGAHPVPSSVLLARLSRI